MYLKPHKVVHVRGVPYQSVPGLCRVSSSEVGGEGEGELVPPKTLLHVFYLLVPQKSSPAIKKLSTFLAHFHALNAYK